VVTDGESGSILAGATGAAERSQEEGGRKMSGSARAQAARLRAGA
jgi:hypothetical protein